MASIDRRRSADTSERALGPTCLRHVNEPDFRRGAVEQRTIERGVADVVAGIDRPFGVEAVPPQRGENT